MPFRIERWTPASTDFQELAADVYEGLRDARIKVSLALGMEEKFNFLLENYREFEQECLDVTLRHLLYDELSWGAFQDEIYAVSRRLSNVLSSARTYCDQVQRDVPGAFAAASAGSVKALFSAEYDARLGYRAMEALRNHAQHRGMALHGLSLPSTREEGADEVRVRHAIVAYVEVDQLRADGKVKRAVINELAGLGGRVPVAPLLRDYVEGLARVHAQLRDLLSAEVDDATSTVREPIRTAQAELGESVHVALVETREDGTIKTRIDLFLDLVDRLTFLQRRTSRIALLHQFVSSEVRRDDLSQR